MGVDIEIRLLDTRLLAEVQSAVGAFVKDADPSAARSLVIRASDTLRRDDESGQTAIAHYLAAASLRLLNGDIPTVVADEHTGKTLTARTNIVEYQAERSINRYLVLFLCAQHFGGTPTVFALSRGDLAEYVRSRSKWLDEMLSMSNELLWEAEPMQPPLGSDAWLLTAEESGHVLQAIRNVEPPSESGNLLAQYTELRHTFEIAAHSLNQRVLITMF